MSFFITQNQKGGGKLAKLRHQWKIFADEYIIHGNIYKSAINAGYSENYARGNASKLLENVSIKAYITKRLEDLEEKAIAKQSEVLRYLTSVMRGEQTEQVLRSAGDFEQVIDDIEVGAKDRIKSAELLGKRYGIWTDKQEINTTIKNDSLANLIDQLKGDDDT